MNRKFFVNRFSADFKTPSAGLRYRIGFTSYIPLSILVTVPCAENTDPTAGKILRIQHRMAYTAEAQKPKVNRKRMKFDCNIMQWNVVRKNGVPEEHNLKVSKI